MTWLVVEVKMVMVRDLKNKMHMVQAKFILEAVLGYRIKITVYQANIKDKQMLRTVLIVYQNRLAKLISDKEVQNKHQQR